MEADDTLRALWRGQQAERVPEMSIETLREESDRIARKAARRRWAEVISGGLSMMLLAALGWGVRAAAPWVSVACLLLVAGEAVVIRMMWRRSSPAMPPLGETTSAMLTHYQLELARERDLFLGYWRWYVTPVVPGLLLFPIGVGAALGWNEWIVGSIWAASLGATWAVIALVTRRVAWRLERQIAALGAT